jgi:hypothetical protein
LEAFSQLPVGIVTTLDSMPLLSNEEDVSSWLNSMPHTSQRALKTETDPASAAANPAGNSKAGAMSMEPVGERAGRQLVSKFGARSFVQRSARLEMWHQVAGTKEHQVRLLMLQGQVIDNACSCYTVLAAWHW